MLNSPGDEEEDSTTEDTESSEMWLVKGHASCLGIGTQSWQLEIRAVSVFSVISVVDSRFFEGADAERSSRSVRHRSRLRPLFLSSLCL